MEEITRVVRAIEEGDSGAADRLLPLVYRELRRLAAHHLAREAPGQTLQATALVHEAYLRVIGNDAEGEGRIGWDGRAHFFAAAAEAMRRILIDSARRKHAQRHGGGMRRVELGALAEAAPGDASHPVDVIALNEALARFSAEDPVKAELVRLRYFAGLSLEEAGAMLHLSRATANRYWVYARAWLHDAIVGAGAEGKPKAKPE